MNYSRSESIHCPWPRHYDDLGVSEASNLLRDWHRDLIQRRHSAETGRNFERAEDAIGWIADNCSTPNWDGEGAYGVSAEAVEEALKLAFQLPQFLESPEIDADPDGSISFVWWSKPGHTVLFNVSGERRLVYAALFGKAIDKHGSERFVNSLPPALLSLVAQLYE